MAILIVGDIDGKTIRMTERVRPIKNGGAILLAGELYEALKAPGENQVKLVGNYEIRGGIINQKALEFGGSKIAGKFEIIEE